jgi:hypothetical protein
MEKKKKKTNKLHPKIGIPFLQFRLYDVADGKLLDYARLPANMLDPDHPLVLFFTNMNYQLTVELFE